MAADPAIYASPRGAPTQPSDSYHTRNSFAKLRGRDHLVLLESSPPLFVSGRGSRGTTRLAPPPDGAFPLSYHTSTTFRSP